MRPQRRDYEADRCALDREHSERLSRVPQASRLLSVLDAVPTPDEVLFREAFQARIQARSAALNASYCGQDMTAEEVAAHLRASGLEASA